MPEEVVYGLLATAAVSAWLLGIVALDVFTPPDARAWKRITSLRGLDRRSAKWHERGMRLRFVQSLSRDLDLQRTIAIAGRHVSPLGFLGETAAIALGAFAMVLAADGIARAASGSWPLPPWASLLFAVAIPILAVIELQRTAARRQVDVGRTLADSLTMIAVMTDTRGLQLDDAVRILSRCATERALRSLIDDRGFKQLVTARYRSTIEQYRLIAAAYGIPQFERVAEAASASNVGVPERDVYTRLALSIYHDRLADARMRAARAKVLVTLPVAGMLIPLLILIGAPTFAAISQGIQGG